MKRIIILLIALWSSTAFAEGGACPAGYYPANSSGVIACAPIPNYGGSNSLAPATIESPVWKTRWIAIAMGGGGFGVGKDQSSQRKAEKIALTECKRTASGGKCAIGIVTYNQCVAASGGKAIASTYGASTRQEAEQGATRACQSAAENAGTTCQVFYTACSYPYRVR